MPAEIINLRRARKAKSRDKHRHQADANRLVHGRTKSEKLKHAAERKRAARLIDGHRREPGEE